MSLVSARTCNSADKRAGSGRDKRTASDCFVETDSVVLVPPEAKLEVELTAGADVVKVNDEVFKASKLSISNIKIID